LIYTLIPFELTYPPIYARRGGRCYWEHYLEPREPIGNLKGTCREQRKSEKIPPPKPKTQKKKEL